MAKAENRNESVLGWVLVGAGAAVTLWLLLKPKESDSVTLVKLVPSSEPPLGFATLGAIRSRFDDLRDIYHMGHVTPDEAISQLDAMQRSAVALSDRGVGDPEAAKALVADLEDFKSKVEDFIAFKKSLEVQG